MKILVIRFSAMGDVAMLSSVIKEVMEQNQNLEITLLSQYQFKPFYSIRTKCKFIGVDLRKYSGLFGIFKLFLLLRKEKFDAIADAHNVLRTIILRLFFLLSFRKIVILNKGRKARKKLLKNKKTPLKSMVERYADIFRKLNLKVSIKNKLINVPLKSKYFKQEFKQRKNIGIAPFAKHISKQYPLDKMTNIILELSNKYNVFLFGGGKEETNLLNEIQKSNMNIHFFRNIGLKNELHLISHLDLMLTMDSANMHMASIVGVKALSIWGGTHHLAGFLGYGQSKEHIIEKKLICRPCSIFGKEECSLEDKYKCLNISEKTIIKKIEDII